jgi:hypothetical protein
MEERVRTSLAPRRFTAGVLTGFGAAALLLASIGIYGVAAYMVGRRKREFAIRLALGASGPQVRRQVVRESLRVVLIGIAIGLPAAPAHDAIRGLLFNVKPGDPLSHLPAAALLGTGGGGDVAAGPAGDEVGSGGVPVGVAALSANYLLLLSSQRQASGMLPVHDGIPPPALLADGAAVCKPSRCWQDHRRSARTLGEPWLAGKKIVCGAEAACRAGGCPADGTLGQRSVGPSVMGSI